MSHRTLSHRTRPQVLLPIGGRHLSPACLLTVLRSCPLATLLPSTESGVSVGSVSCDQDLMTHCPRSRGGVDDDASGWWRASSVWSGSGDGVSRVEGLAGAISLAGPGSL